MEQHPVPQNVTTFQFRLIGDMTLKQFGYLCAGAILAFIAYKLPLPFIITWPLTMVFVFLGIGFAFIPVEERPMDVWVFSFFKSIYTPTQYLWTREAVQPHPVSQQAVTPPQSQPAPPVAAPAPAPTSVLQPSRPIQTTITPPSPAPTSQPPAPIPAVIRSEHVMQPATPPITQQTRVPAQQSSAVLSDLFRPSSTPVHPPIAPAMTMHHSESMWDRILAFLGLKSAPAAAPSHSPPAAAPRMKQVAVPSVTGLRPVAPEQHAPPTQSPPPIAQDAVVHEKVARLEENIANLEQKLKTTSSAEDRVLELQKQLTDLLNQKSKTDDELASLRRAMLSKPEPNAPQQGGEQRRGSVNMITTQEAAVKAGLPRLTNVPNVITGIVKDDEGNLLPSILVTVTNAEGLPMRALKTNKLGQFGASTPLAQGTYYVEIEDPRGKYTFSRVQITLTGGVLPVLEILAKSEKALTREKLTKEIFGTPNT